MEILFEMERPTKNTVRFSEVLDDEMDEPKIGTLYVRKNTLDEMGYQDGDNLIVTLDIAD